MITEMESMGEQVQLPYCKKQRFLAKGISLHGLRVTAAIAIALWAGFRHSLLETAAAYRF